MLILRPSTDGVCGLPEYINSLPDYAQVELRDLWSTYISGTPCDKELAIQQDVLNVVNTFSRDFVEKSTFHRESNGCLKKPLVRKTTVSARSHKTFLTETAALKSGFFQATIDDIATKRFNNRHATFLHSVPPEVRRKFEKVWNDDDIPSEALRTLKIQTLAVSLLTGKQLEEYNRWATKRRYVLKAREHELRRLSPDAKRTLRRISNRCMLSRSDASHG
ncbi:unnamed protein product [Heligmosomoides polygyrus]|uniref:Uncharacterized protein n=1 Tax=Heligmosomoides polygyrus TaxID=6339 RepID=A0A3P7X535_HELPZ|nr:unnamed protein product [Heligmosomoides polygyrus]